MLRKPTQEIEIPAEVVFELKISMEVISIRADHWYISRNHLMEREMKKNLS